MPELRLLPNPVDYINNSLQPLGKVLDAQGAPHVLLACCPTLEVLHVVSNLQPKSQADLLEALGRKLIEHALEVRKQKNGNLILPPGFKS